MLNARFESGLRTFLFRPAERGNERNRRKRRNMTLLWRDAMRNLSEMENSMRKKKKRTGIPVVSVVRSMKTGKVKLRTDRIIKTKEPLKLSTDYEACRFASEHLFNRNPVEEIAYVVGLDASDRPIAVSEVSHGTADMALLFPRDVFVRVLLMGAVSMILFHNHCDDPPVPSAEDRAISERIRFLGSLIGISLYDHVIAGENEFTSALWDEKTEKERKDETYA